jgi:hypothetical protein
MERHIQLLVGDDNSIVIDGRRYTERAELADALRSAATSDPEALLVISPGNSDNYGVIGKIIYASQFAGIPAGRLHYTRDDGEIVSFDV